jgi:membrane protein DedA with SNARE-associated domain
MLNWITNTIASLGYGGIALLMLLENIIPPIPSEVIMPLAGFTITQGTFNFPSVILAGTIGSVLGALPWYWIGKYMGEKRLRQWIDRHGKWLTLSGQDIDRSKHWFNRYGSAVVFFGRCIPGIRTFISVPAGLEGMPLLPFLLYSTLGTVLWISLLTYAGYLLGQNYQRVEQVLGPVAGVVIVGLLIVVILWIAQRKRKQKR